MVVKFACLELSVWRSFNVHGVACFARLLLRIRAGKPVVTNPNWGFRVYTAEKCRIFLAENHLNN